MNIFKLLNLTSTFIILLNLYFIVCWIINLVQFFKLDFAPSWKLEFIKAIGIIIFPASGITVWF